MWFIFLQKTGLVVHLMLCILVPTIPGKLKHVTPGNFCGQHTTSMLKQDVTHLLT